MAEEHRGGELVTRYDNVKNQIMRAIFKSSADPFYRSPLEDLKKTVCSMEPMVEDMEVSEIASPRYKFMTRKFLPLLEQFEHRIGLFLESELPAASYSVGKVKASIFRVFGIKLPESYIDTISYKNDLEIVRQRFKDLFSEYIKVELDKLAMSNEEVVDEGVLERLLRYLLSKIRDEASKPSSEPVFQKIELILDSIETQFHSRRQQSSKLSSANMAQLLHLLKEVKLLHRFLNGDHGLDIPNHLWESENALRMFVTYNALSQLKELDRYYEKLQREKEITITFLWLLLVVLMFACLLSKADYPNRPSDLVTFTVIVIFIVLLAYTLAMQVSVHVRWERSLNQMQSLNSNNAQLQREKEIRITSLWLLLAVLIYSCLLDIPEYPNHHSECVVIIVVVIFIVMLAYTLATQVFNHVRLGRSRSHDKQLSSNSTNPRTELQSEEEMQKERLKTFLWLLLAVLMFGYLLNKPEYPNRPSDFVIITVVVIFIVMLAYTLAMQVFDHVRLGQSRSHYQQLSSNSTNPHDYQEKVPANLQMDLFSLALKTNKAGHHDEQVHAAATQIQNKFRSWKGRKDFLILRQRIVKIQAHVRGHQVRKNYR